MYIWKTTSLATDIKNDDVGAKEWKKYYLALSIFGILSMYIVAPTPRESMVAVLVEAIAMVGILIFGVNITYRSNKGDSGVDYIARMTALSLPIIVRLLVLTSLIGAYAGVFGISEAAMEWLIVGVSVVVLITLFWRINIHIKYINA